MQQSNVINATGRTHLRFHWLAAVLVLLLGINVPAHAQGTMGAVPDPISTRELASYMNRLRLSDHQRVAVDHLHAIYREEFRLLRETDIEKFINESADLMRGGMGAIMNVDRQEVKKSLSQLDNLLGRIRAFDEGFFDQLQSILTDEQMQIMPRVRQARERVRYQSGMGRMVSFINPASQVELTEFVDELDLSPQEFEQVDLLMAQYEASLTAAARRLHNSGSTFILDFLDVMQSLGVSEEAMRDRQRRAAMFDGIRQAWQDISSKLHDQSKVMSSLNRRTLRSLEQVLSPADAARLRERFFRSAYPDAAYTGPVLDAYELAMKLDHLTDEQRQAVTSMATELRTTLNRIADQLADLIDENPRGRMMLAGDDARQQYEDKTRRLRDQRTAVAENAAQVLKDLLGPELSEQLQKRVALAEESDQQPEVVSVQVTGGSGAAVVTTRTSIRQNGDDIGIDPFLPQPISSTDIDEYASRLGVSDDVRTIMAGLHSEYQEKFRLLETEGAIKAVREAERRHHVMDSQSGEILPPAPEQVDSLYALRRQALTAVEQLDAQFFTDLALILSGDDAESKVSRLRLARQRAMYSRNAASNVNIGFGGPRQAQRGGRVFAGGFGESNEAAVDVALLVENLDLTPTEPEAFHAALHDYEQAVTTAFRELFEANMRMRQSMEKLMTQARIETSGDRGRSGQFQFNNMRSVMQNEGRAAREMRQKVASLNRDTLTRLAALLPSENADALQQAYNRKAYPDVYRDPRSAQPHLSAALMLSDLADQQLSQIQELALEFRAKYDELTDQLVQLLAANHEPANFADASFRNWIRERERLEFDRNELSDRTIARLSTILTEEQVQRLGGLSLERTSQQ